MKRKYDSSKDTKSKRRREDRHLSTVHVPSMPLFFNLVDNVTVISNHPLPFTCHLSSLAESYGLNAFARGNTIRANTLSDEKMDLERQCAQFYSSLCYYRHPQPLSSLIRTQLNQAAGDVTKLQGEAGEFIQERISRWTQAFTSLYSMLRNGKCPYFYVRAPKMNAVLFLAHGVSGKDIRAIWNAPSSKNRSDLQRYCIQYKEVLSIDQESGDGANSTIQPLLFSGKKEVHGLFNFLLIEACGTGLKWLREDVPELLSSTPFIFGTLENAEVKQVREHSNVGSSIIRQQENVTELESDKKYILHMSGMFMPHTIQHMANIFQSSFSPNESSRLTFNFRVVPETRFFNCVKTPGVLNSSFLFSKIIAQEASEIEFEYLDQKQISELNNNVVKSVVLYPSEVEDEFIYQTSISDRVD